MPNTRGEEGHTKAWLCGVGIMEASLEICLPQVGGKFLTWQILLWAHFSAVWAWQVFAAYSLISHSHRFFWKYPNSLSCFSILRVLISEVSLTYLNALYFSHSLCCCPVPWPTASHRFSFLVAVLCPCSEWSLVQVLWEFHAGSGATHTWLTRNTLLLFPYKY